MNRMAFRRGYRDGFSLEIILLAAVKYAYDHGFEHKLGAAHPRIVRVFQEYDARHTVEISISHR